MVTCFIGGVIPAAYRENKRAATKMVAYKFI